MLAWLNCVPLLCCYSLLCVILLVPYSLGSHAQLGGGSVAERSKSTLAYGWVERCSDVAGYGMSSYKISNLVYFTSAILFTVNDYDEHVE